MGEGIEEWERQRRRREWEREEMRSGDRGIEEWERGERSGRVGS